MVRLQAVYPPDLAGFLHADEVFVKTGRDDIGVGWDRLCSEALHVLFLLIDDHVGVVPIISLHGASLRLEISRLDQL